MCSPHQIADETFVVHHSVSTHPVASMVVRGAEPLVIGAGMPAAGDVADDIFGLLPAPAVRWIFVSHARRIHAGNLLGLLANCADAKVVTSWLTVQRLACAGLFVPAGRLHLVDDGDVFDAGDRAYLVERPPLHSEPDSLGLLDSVTGVAWTAECFSAILDRRTVLLDDADLGPWHAAFVRYHHLTCPWVHAVDASWWQRTVDRMASRQAAALVPLHGPSLLGDHVREGIEALRELPALSPVRSGAASSP